MEKYRNRLLTISILLCSVMLLIVVSAVKGDESYDEALRLNNEAGPLIDENKDLERAIKLMNKAIELVPNNSRFYYNRGEALTRSGNHALAIKDFTKSIELDPGDYGGYYSRGIVYYLFSKNYLGAVEDFNKAIERNPKIPGAYSMRGLSFRQLGLMSKACEDLKKACDMGDCLAWEHVKKTGECY